MSTSLLNHGFGLIHQEYLKTEYIGGKIIFHIRKKPSELRCSNCNGYKVKLRGFVIRDFKTLPIGSRPVILHALLQRLECYECGVLAQEKIDFADFQKSYTKQLARYIIDLSSSMTIKDIAVMLGMNWNTIRDIVKEDLKKRYSTPKLKDVEIIAIDELALQKGHKYLTIVMNLATGAVLFVGKGKGADSLKPFWKRLNKARSKIKAVAIDMSPAYIEAVVSSLKDSQIVFDHFHIIKMYNDKLSDLRRDIYNQEIAIDKKK